MTSIETLTKHYRQIRSDLGDANFRRMLTLPATLPATLRKFFNERITVERAEEEIKRALDSREDRFLELVHTQIYQRPNSPYLRLLKIAGCDFSDLVTNVRCHGLEETLKRLASEGVYLTADEFKGKKEVVRKGESFRVSPCDFDPTDVSAGFVTQSSGTSNQPVRSLSPLDWLAKETLTAGIFLSAHGLLSHSHAAYDPILPGTGGIMFMLQLAKLGIPSDRWFARKVPINSWLEGAYYYATAYEIVLTGNWFGPGFPKPEFLDPREVYRIVRWVLDKKREGKVCCIRTVASNAARIARVAWDMGVSLEGTTFISSGEPLTEGKREMIERSGGRTTLLYGYTPGPVHVSLGCANPIHTDEMHVNQNMLAVIPHPNSITDDSPPIHPLLFTTLYPSASRLQLNVENGDYATMERRDCGCALEKVGLTLHLHHIRSYEKFTSEGMNYFYADLFQLVEETLPSEFGGGPGDYQLVEEEDSNGQTRLSLLVDPDVKNLNEERLVSRLHEALAQGSRGNRFMSKLWQDAGTFRIKREIPFASPRGKILPLHIRH